MTEETVRSSSGEAVPRSLATRVAARFHSVGDVWLAARIMGWACLMPILKQVIPLRTLVSLVRRDPRSGRTADTSAPIAAPRRRDTAREDQVVTFARWACRLTRWSSGGNCLERGLIAYRYLGALDAHPTLVVGVGRGEAGAIRGHAWILLDGRPVGERNSLLLDYTPVLMFGPDGLPSTAPGGAATKLA